jgi:hypothetical protein
VDKTKKASKDLHTKANTFEDENYLGAKGGESLTTNVLLTFSSNQVEAEG